MIYGIFYGILIALFFYCAAPAIRLNNRSAIWFALYIICTGLFIGAYDGDLHKLLKPVFGDQNRIIFIAIVGLLYFIGFKFLRTFLNVGCHSRLIDRIMISLQWMGLIFIPMNLMSNPLTLPFNIILVGIGPVFSNVISIYFWIKGVLHVRFFAIGWIFGHITFEIFLLRVFGVIPWIPGNLYLLPVAMLTSIVFFCIAVTDQSRDDQDQSYRDNLTGIANRRLFDQALSIEWNRNLRSQQPLSVIMADIDNFNAFNDTYGYKRGDDCLKVIARIFDKNLQRAGDLAARYGGEEFIAVLPDTLAVEANFLAEKIREQVERLAIIHSTSSTGKILTVSLGSGTMIPNATLNPADLLLKADDALCEAKNQGRNRVVSLEEPVKP